MEKTEVIKTCKLFAGFPDDAVSYVADLCEEREFPAGGDVFVQGGAGSSLFVIGSGMVRIVVRRAGGPESVLGSLVAGEYFGGMSLLRGGARMVTARADSNTEILELSQQKFLNNMQKERPQQAMKLLLALVMDLTKLIRENESFFREALAARTPPEM
jgi:CRP-like cAMP-binding protein